MSNPRRILELAIDQPFDKAASLALDRELSDEAPAGIVDLIKAAGLAALGESPTPDAIDSALRDLKGRVNGADPLRRSLIRVAAIDALKACGLSSPAQCVDAALGESPTQDGKELQGAALLFAELEPWPDPVDGEQLLSDLLATFTKHLVLPRGAAVAMSLWALHAHAHDAFQVSPILTFRSATKRTGKTTSQTLLGSVVPRYLQVSNITAAMLFRIVDASAPTLLIDEADSFLCGNEELRGLLNSGHTRAGAVVPRAVGDDFEPRLFSTWCPKSIALINDLPATLEDRSITITMRRRAPGEKVTRLRLDRLGEFQPLCRRAARWAEDNIEALRIADPAVPDGLHDRAADNWRPLLAIAELCGGWADEAQAAATILTGTEEAETTAPVRLLADVKALFEAEGKDRLTTAAILAGLHALEERPWGEWGRQRKPISSNQLARLLKPFGVVSEQAREGDKVLRGYLRSSFVDAWGRYVADEKEASATPKPLPALACSSVATQKGEAEESGGMS